MTTTAPANTFAQATSSLPTQHRRVALQSPLDLNYLSNNARAAARAKIDLHLPVQDSSSQNQTSKHAAVDKGGRGTESVGYGDDMRRAVERSVDRYIEETFEMVKRGVDVNGIEGEGVEWGDVGGPEEFEPYDHDLASRITSLHANIEQLNQQLAITRREAAGKAAQQFQESFTEQTDQVDAALGQQEEAAIVAGDDIEAPVELGIRGREEDVLRTWEGALEGLQRLQGGLGESRERAEGAEKVVSHLEGK